MHLLESLSTTNSNSSLADNLNCVLTLMVKVPRNYHVVKSPPPPPGGGGGGGLEGGIGWLMVNVLND